MFRIGSACCGLLFPVPGPIEAGCTHARTTVQGPESWPREATCLLRQPLPELMLLCCTQWQNRFRERFQSPGSRLPTDGLGISNSFIPTSWIGGQWLFFHHPLHVRSIRDAIQVLRCLLRRACKNLSTPRKPARRSTHAQTTTHQYNDRTLLPPNRHFGSGSQNANGDFS
jgi:hypothetical protein